MFEAAQIRSVERCERLQRRSIIVVGFSLAAVVGIANASVEEVVVTKGMGDKAIIQRNNGEQYLIEKGLGCYSLWCHDGRRVLISSPGSFLDVGAHLMIPELDQDCRISKAELIGSATPPTSSRAKEPTPGPAVPPETLAVALQLALRLVGHDPGSTDGVVSMKTTAALAAFAREKGYKASAADLRATLASLAREVLKAGKNSPFAMKIAGRVDYIATQRRTSTEKTPTSTTCEDGHRVDSVTSDGGIVRMEDGSVWEIDPANRVDTVRWLPTEDIVICHGRLINTRNGEAVSATRLR